MRFSGLFSHRFHTVRGRHRRALAASTLGVALTAAPATAQLSVSVYGGVAKTLDGAVGLARPDGTDLTFADVSWRGESFKSPIYYGLRLTYWLGYSANWGVALDFTHAKMLAVLDDTVSVSGRREGSAVDGRERLGDTFTTLSFSHGHNLLTLNAMYRWFPKSERDETALGRLQAHFGLGLGLAIPHVETDIDGVITGEYQTSGLAVEARVGLDFEIVRRLSLLAEYKLSYARLDADLAGGASVDVRPWTHHAVLGISFNL